MVVRAGSLVAFGKACADALERKGYRITRIDVKRHRNGPRSIEARCRW
jgi:hypothetical protein